MARPACNGKRDFNCQGELVYSIKNESVHYCIYGYQDFLLSLMYLGMYGIIRPTGIQLVVAHAKNHADGNYLLLYHIIGR